MTLTQLQYVVALDRFRNFHRAADHCNVTQPTLSAQLQKLEEELEEILFNRSTQPIEPTEVGIWVIEQAKRVLFEAEKIKEEVGQEPGQVRGSLRIGVIPTISAYLMPLFFEAVYEKYPNLVVEISELTTPNCLQALDREEIDVAILATKEDRKKYFQETLYDEEMFLFFNKNHPLLAKEAVASDELDPKELWVLEEGHCLRDEVLKVCQLRTTSKMRPKNLMYKVGSLESLRYLVEESYGYTLLPKLATLKLSSREKKLLRPITGNPVRSIVLTKNKHNLKSRQINAFKEVLLEKVPEGTGL
ncbi:MAG: LysR family transcriptional regulator [Bdellovibrionales bacterium]|nr:LysR family transcriptional regulator [Bdellovibrionales bacterium]